MTEVEKLIEKLRKDASKRTPEERTKNVIRLQTFINQMDKRREKLND